jgi:hypothetical protein
VHPVRVDFHHEQHVQALQEDRVDVEEIAGQQPAGPALAARSAKTYPHRAAGPSRSPRRIRRTVESLTRYPRRISSPRTRRYPHRGFSRASRGITAARTRALRAGRPGRRGDDRCRSTGCWGAGQDRLPTAGRHLGALLARRVDGPQRAGAPAALCAQFLLQRLALGSASRADAPRTLTLLSLDPGSSRRTRSRCRAQVATCFSGVRPEVPRHACRYPDDRDRLPGDTRIASRLLNECESDVSVGCAILGRQELAVHALGTPHRARQDWIGHRHYTREDTPAIPDLTTEGVASAEVGPRFAVSRRRTRAFSRPVLNYPGVGDQPSLQ